MDNFRRRVEGVIAPPELVSTTYTLLSIKSNPTITFTNNTLDYNFSGNFNATPSVCPKTFSANFTKTDTYSDGSVVTSTITKSATSNTKSAKIKVNTTSSGSTTIKDGPITSFSFSDVGSGTISLVVQSLLSPSFNQSSDTGTLSSGWYALKYTYSGVSKTISSVKINITKLDNDTARVNLSLN